MAVLIPDEKCLVFQVKIFFGILLYAAGYHPGPVTPPSADGASLFCVSELMSKNSWIREGWGVAVLPVVNKPRHS